VKRLAHIVVGGIAFGLWMYFSRHAGWRIWVQLAGATVVIAAILLSANALFGRKRFQ
jgi:hypothetical protein